MTARSPAPPNEGTHLFAPRLVKVAPDDAGCTWAPEAVYDEETADYFVFWASTTAGDDFAKHRIWAARTKDFRSFGKPLRRIHFRFATSSRTGPNNPDSVGFHSAASKGL